MTAKSVHELVSKGLYADNLRELIELCGPLIPQKPSLYGSLLLIFVGLLDEYDNQAVLVSRSRAIEDALKAPILALLDAETSSPQDLLSCLDNVFYAYANLKRL